MVFNSALGCYDSMDRTKAGAWVVSCLGMDGWGLWVVGSELKSWKKSKGKGLKRIGVDMFNKPPNPPLLKALECMQKREN